uniref:Uncharacterized protein n=1 Tax=Oryza meridionalis TaxID=40149 RepID=A0A0E0BX98_9ORYZ
MDSTHNKSHRRIWFVDDHKSGEIILEFNDRLNKWGVISLRSDSGYMPTSPSLLLPVPWIMIHERGKEKAYGRKCSGLLLTERFILDDTSITVVIDKSDNDWASK